MIDVIDSKLRDEAEGKILAREATHWNLELDSCDETIRVSFDDPAETRFVVDAFQGGGVFDHHPLLWHWQDQTAYIHVVQNVESASGVLDEIRSTVNSWSQGWRTADEYINEDAWPEDVTRAGNGLLLTGPKSLAYECAKVLRYRGIEFSTSLDREPSLARLRVLICGSSFVVARQIRAEVVSKT